MRSRPRRGERGLCLRGGKRFSCSARGWSWAVLVSLFSDWIILFGAVFRILMDVCFHCPSLVNSIHLEERLAHPHDETHRRVRHFTFNKSRNP